MSAAVATGDDGQRDQAAEGERTRETHILIILSDR